MRMERMVDMTARNYELNDEQTEMVRTEMQKMRDERKMLMGADYDKYEQLREKMFEFWQTRGPGPGAEGNQRRGGDRGDGEAWRRMREDPEFQKLREEMRSIDQKYPFDWQASVRRIESLLPPEQAAKGRERFDRRRSRWDARREARENELQDAMTKALKDSEQAMAAGRGDRAKEILDEAMKRIEDERMPEDMRLRLTKRIEQVRQQVAPGAEAPEMAPEHPWEKHVREFSAKYGLTPSQQSAALSILKDVRDRAAQFELTNSQKIAAAREIADAKEREARLKELNAPIENLFAELNARLDKMLTAEQRKKAEK